jgi:hypothetical protein
MEKVEKLDLHDSILKKVNIDPVNFIISFELDFIVDLYSTKERKQFRPIRRPAKLNLINYKKASFKLKRDINKEIILDFEMKKVRNKTKGPLHFHIYTSSDSTFDVYCEDYNFKFTEKETIDPSKTIVFPEE